MKVKSFITLGPEQMTVKTDVLLMQRNPKSVEYKMIMLSWLHVFGIWERIHKTSFPFQLESNYKKRVLVQNKLNLVL